MADWVFCNKCSLKLTSTIKFNLSDCGHILCQKCVENKNTNTCLICKKNCCFVPLDKNLNKNVMEYFQSIDTHCKKILEVYKFQMQHRELLFGNLKNKYEIAKKEYIKLQHSAQAMHRKNQMLVSMLRSHGIHPSKVTTSTPVGNISDNCTFQNGSIISSVAPNTHVRSLPGYAQRLSSFHSASPSDQSSVGRVPTASKNPGDSRVAAAHNHGLNSFYSSIRRVPNTSHNSEDCGVAGIHRFPNNDVHVGDIGYPFPHKRRH